MATRHTNHLTATPSYSAILSVKVLYAEYVKEEMRNCSQGALWGNTFGYRSVSLALLEGYALRSLGQLFQICHLANYTALSTSTVKVFGSSEPYMSDTSGRDPPQKSGARRGPLET